MFRDKAKEIAGQRRLQHSCRSGFPVQTLQRDKVAEPPRVANRRASQHLRGTGLSGWGMSCWKDRIRNLRPVI